MLSRKISAVLNKFQYWFSHTTECVDKCNCKIILDKKIHHIFRIFWKNCTKLTFFIRTKRKPHLVSTEKLMSLIVHWSNIST